MSENIKTQALCDRCKINRLCEEKGFPCSACKASNDTKYGCGCISTPIGETCPYYEAET